MLTVLSTCIAHGVNPRAYLHAVTKRIVNGCDEAQLRDLLPDRIHMLYPELEDVGTDGLDLLDLAPDLPRLPRA